MSRTLFKYIFWDLLRIFAMTNGALSGIMSFAGLLRPLTQNGLDAGQVGKLLTYFTPSMMAYSFPIAALFAATVVYGRMNADNEIIACRAGGISNGMLALPAFVLGSIVAIVSLLFLCYVVPLFTLKVEKVIYSNLAQLVANKIERNHQIKSDNSTVFAQRAEVMPADPAQPLTQRVVLEGPTIISYDVPDKSKPAFRVPDQFWMARKATMYIKTDPDGDNAEMTVALDGGMKFPRRTGTSFEGGVQETQFGPTKLQSQIREDTKFMDITRLKEVDADKSKSAKIQSKLASLVADEQESTYLATVLDDLNDSTHEAEFRSGKDVYRVTRAGGTTSLMRGERLVTTSDAAEKRLIHVEQQREGVTTLSADAGEVRLHARADVDGQHITVSIDMYNVVLHATDADVMRGGPITQTLSVDMPPKLAALNAASPEKYASADPAAPNPRKILMRELLVLKNDIASEMHIRCAFASSCLILVMMGCAMGMMFRTGNFLSAFAVSFGPAMLCITLIIAGQRTAGNIPMQFFKYQDPLRLGLTILWSGNAMVSVLAGSLLWRLHRQ